MIALGTTLTCRHSLLNGELVMPVEPLPLYKGETERGSCGVQSPALMSGFRPTRWGSCSVDIAPRSSKVAVFSILLLLVPHTTHAETLKQIINGNIIPIFNSLVGLIMVLALLGFIAGVIRFMYTAGDDKSRSDGKTLMVWGTVALFLMISIWGVVTIVRDTFFGTV